MSLSVYAKQEVEMAKHFVVMPNQDETMTFAQTLLSAPAASRKAPYVSKTDPKLLITDLGPEDAEAIRSRGASISLLGGPCQ